MSCNLPTCSKYHSDCKRCILLGLRINITFCLKSTVNNEAGRDIFKQLNLHTQRSLLNPIWWFVKVIFQRDDVSASANSVNGIALKSMYSSSFWSRIGFNDYFSDIYTWKPANSNNYNLKYIKSTLKITLFVHVTVCSIILVINRVLHIEGDPPFFFFFYLI